jgi:proteasome activator subunit 4
VKILRVPALLSMFDKDPISMGYTQAAIRCLAALEPSLIMPELLDRAYGGLEAVNETHRTTAVLGMMSSISRPLVTEKLWLAGQKHTVALLESALPGIDLNDPTKTLCSSLFVLAVVQFMKIGDLSGVQVDSVPGDMIEVDEEVVPFPEGTEPEGPALSREDERVLTRDSTAGFAGEFIFPLALSRTGTKLLDWITSLFRRIFALYENLPEEGGRRETTGGKSEEAVLKSIKNMMDVVCLHLSKPLFDLVLKLVYEYATTNARANSVRAFGGLVSCLARAYPRETLDKFLPYCASQIEEELNHGASSIRTTSSHQAVPSDTTLHWSKCGCARSVTSPNNSEQISQYCSVWSATVDLMSAEVSQLLHKPY